MITRRPRADPAVRLLTRRAIVGRQLRPLPVALGIALLLHLLAGTALLLHPPTALVPAPAEPPAREATVDLVQNDMPSESDQSTGGTGHSNATTQPPPAQQKPPSPPSPPAQAAAPQPTPDLPSAPDQPSPPPQPPATPTPAMQTPAAPTPAAPNSAAPAPDATQDAAVRVASEDDAEGTAGGTADTPAAPDPARHNKLPAYPTAAARSHQQGEVDIIVHVAPDGTPAQLVIANSSGSAALDEAATRAVQRWRFKPALAHGKPIFSDAPVRLNFVLR